MATTETLVALAARADSTSRPSYYKAIGLTLAMLSGCFIGVSFVLKKIGLLQANKKYDQAAGEGYGYLKNWFWWLGMTLMIIGEICNFVAYAFVDAILVTPMGALTVVVTAILSAIFLKERLSFVGKLGCFNCIVGSVVIVLNAPSESTVSDIQEMQHYVIAPGFLAYAGVVILIALFMIFWAGPRYGKKSMLIYISVCSWIGGLSVVATQGLGAAIIAQIGGESQFTHWFLYVLLVFVVCTLLTEIVYLNKALNLFNAALVTPTYYVYFTTTTIITSAILFRGFKGSAISITTVILGFLQICTGVVLLQLAKSSKDVPDTAVFKGDLDQVRTIAEQEEPEYEPRADTIRGGGALLRGLSKHREKRAFSEAKSLRTESMEPIGEDEVVEWDGLRRRKTVLGPGSVQSGSLRRAPTLHPPLGMSKFPSDDVSEVGSDDVHPGFFPRFGRRSTRGSRTSSAKRRASSPVAMTGLQPINDNDDDDWGVNEAHKGPEEHVFGLPPGLRPHTDGARDTAYHSPNEHIRWNDGPEQSPTRLPSETRPTPPAHKSGSYSGSRAFSFQKPPSSQRTFSFQKPPSRAGSPFDDSAAQQQMRPPKIRASTNKPSEEERLGLVKGDSRANIGGVYDSSPVASPEKPLMQSHMERQERESRLRNAAPQDSDDDWHAPSTQHMQHGGHGRSPEDIAEQGLASQRTPRADDRGGQRRGYQRGRYVDSDEDDDYDTGLGPAQREHQGF